MKIRLMVVAIFILAIIIAIFIHQQPKAVFNVETNLGEDGALLVSFKAKNVNTVSSILVTIQNKTNEFTKMITPFVDQGGLKIKLKEIEKVVGNKDLTIFLWISTDKGVLESKKYKIRINKDSFGVAY